MTYRKYVYSIIMIYKKLVYSILYDIQEVCIHAVHAMYMNIGLRWVIALSGSQTNSASTCFRT